MTAQITGVFANECHWPLERAVNPISLIYTSGNVRARLGAAHLRHGGELRYRGAQGEETITTYEFTSPGQLWERLAERS